MNEVVKYTTTRTYDSDTPLEILGVPGRLKARSTCAQTVVGCWEHQSWISERRTATVDGQKILMHAEIRFDDNCHNRHNSFAITGHGWYDHFKARDWDFGGCCHDMIEKVFPELAPLIQWHLVDTDGPMHYIANTVYHASDLHNGKAKGEPNQWETRVQLGNWPMRLKLEKDFLAWLLAAIEHRKTTPASNPHRKLFDIVAVPYVKKPGGGDYQFGPNYSFDDFTTDWYKAPFKTMTDALEFKEALAQVRDEVTVVKVVTGYSPGKERNFAAARNSANWPDATDEQLSLPEPELRALLEARLPPMLDEFRAAMKGIGFYWSPEEFDEAHAGTDPQGA